MMTKHNPPEGFQRRLYDVWLASRIPLTDISRQTGISRSCLYAYILNGAAPNVTSFAGICSALHVSADYLLFGKGEPPVYSEPEGIPDARFKSKLRKEA